ncbi:hypothetical protein VMCG_09429 [Cytospora schulzeri]|uniref:SnoaL-like domain-containing protein n=1 Tax=Cytospora schulzeri TaxID=448051 RepID=A0A423VKJ9_9PEZI|nr:hypothetical protein VMCG_09429 [Valsa malicola]
MSSLPAKLSPPLSDRDAINDAIYRAVIGLDTNDANLFDSAITDDGIFDLNGKIMEGRAAMHSQMFDFISQLDTTHIVTNTRVNIDEGGTTASATATAMAQHYRGGQGADPAAPRYMSGVLYWLDLVKDEGDGLWKAKHWKLRSIWGEGDRGVMTGN